MINFNCHVCGRPSSKERFEDIKKVAREQIMCDLNKYPICDECYASLVHYKCPKCGREMFSIYDDVAYFDWESRHGCECGYRVFGLLNLEIIPDAK